MIYEKKIGIEKGLEEMTVLQLLVTTLIIATVRGLMIDADWADGKPVGICYRNSPDPEDFDIELMFDGELVTIRIHDDVDDIHPRTPEDFIIGNSHYDKVKFDIQWLDDRIMCTSIVDGA